MRRIRSDTQARQPSGRRRGGSPIADPRGDFPSSTDTLTRELAALVRLIHTELPNVKLAYFTSRIYAG